MGVLVARVDPLGRASRLPSERARDRARRKRIIKSLVGRKEPERQEEKQWNCCVVAVGVATSAAL